MDPKQDFDLIAAVYALHATGASFKVSPDNFVGWGGEQYRRITSPTDALFVLCEAGATLKIGGKVKSKCTCSAMPQVLKADPKMQAAAMRACSIHGV